MIEVITPGDLTIPMMDQILQIYENEDITIYQSRSNDQPCLDNRYFIILRDDKSKEIGGFLSFDRKNNSFRVGVIYVKEKHKGDVSVLLTRLHEYCLSITNPDDKCQILAIADMSLFDYWINHGYSFYAINDEIRLESSLYMRMALNLRQQGNPKSNAEIAVLYEDPICYAISKYPAVVKLLKQEGQLSNIVVWYMLAQYLGYKPTHNVNLDYTSGLCANKIMRLLKNEEGN